MVNCGNTIVVCTGFISDESLQVEIVVVIIFDFTEHLIEDVPEFCTIG